MKSYTKGTISSAFKTIRANKARSLTTMLGIIIGVVSAIIVVGIGQGARVQVGDQINRLGKDLIVVTPGQSATRSGLFGSLGALKAPPIGANLTAADVRVAGQASGVKAVVPLSVVDGTVQSDGGHFSGQVVGTSSQFASVVHQGVAFGGFFSPDPSDIDMAVIGQNVAAELFGENVPLGRAFTFRGHSFIVTGIFKPFDAAPLSSQVDFNNAIFIPYQTAQGLTGNSASIYQIIVQPEDVKRVDTTIRDLTSKLTRSHGGQHNFTVLKQDQSLGVTNSILSLLSAMVLAAAATSLIVGGVGIMNIMLVSIAERLHEIGIRKAVGATNRQILIQFMSEALILSIAGWVIGTLVAIGLIYLVKLFSTLEPVIPWAMVLVSLVGTLAVGTLFGSIPAIKAARKDPIEALRSE
jgi:putative ABC transport system permease protein